MDLAQEVPEYEMLRTWALRIADQKGLDLGAVRIHRVPRKVPFALWD